MAHEVEALKTAMARTRIPFEEITSARVYPAPNMSFRVVMETESGEILTEVVTG